LADDHDTSIASYAFQANEDDLLIGPDTDTDALKLDSNKDFRITAGSLRVDAGGKDIVLSGVSTHFSDTVTVSDGSATTFLTFTLADGAHVSGNISYEIYVVTATPHYQVHSGIITFAAVNKSNTITTDIDEVYLAASTTTVVTSDTLTDTWTFVDNGDGTCSLKLNADTSLADATITLKYHCTVFADQPTRTYA
jgi:hypothetical protein